MLEFIPYAACASLAEAHRLLLGRISAQRRVAVDALHLSRGNGSPDDLKDL
jgi:hypothetical protein